MPVYPEDMDALCNEAIQKWGMMPQLDQVIEEAAELIVAVNHYRRAKRNTFLEPDTKFKAVHSLITEIVDVEIMLHQLKRILGPVYSGDIMRERHNKVKRFRERVKHA